MGLWLSWILLALVLINEKINVIIISKQIIYIPALSLIGLHIYNLKCCQYCAKNE